MIMEKCPSCGKEIQEGIKFCPACGSDVTAKEPEPEPVEPEAPSNEAVDTADAKKPKAPRATGKLRDRVTSLAGRPSFVISVSVVSLLLLLLFLVISSSEAGIPRISYVDVDKAVNITGSTQEVTYLKDVEKSTAIYEEYKESIDDAIAGAGFENSDEMKKRIVAIAADLPLEGRKRFLRGLSSTVELARADNPGMVADYTAAYIELFASEYELSKDRTAIMRTTLIKVSLFLCIAVFIFLGMTAILSIMRLDQNVRELKEKIIDSGE